MKELEIGRDYYTVFGDSAVPGKPKNQLIYLGGIKFRAINTDGQVVDRDSQDTYAKIHEWINRPNISMGMPGGFK